MRETGLARTYSEIDWLKRLDQQLVYVPTSALGAAIGGLVVRGTRLAPFLADWFQVGLLATWVLLSWAILRNRSRHRKLNAEIDRLTDRRRGRDFEFEAGRLIYWLMISLVFIGSCRVLTWASGLPE